MRFFKNASKKVVQGQWKKSLCDLGRARPQKSVFPLAQEKKMELESKKKTRKNDVLAPEMKN